MSIFLFSILSGIGFALLTVALMLPMKWETKRKKTEAILSAAIERFIIGFMINNVSIISSIPLNALLIGSIMSIPSAIITRAYIPIMIIGAGGSFIIGILRDNLIK